MRPNHLLIRHHGLGVRRARPTGLQRGIRAVVEAYGGRDHGEATALGDGARLLAEETDVVAGVVDRSGKAGGRVALIDGEVGAVNVSEDVLVAVGRGSAGRCRNGGRAGT